MSGGENKPTTLFYYFGYGSNLSVLSLRAKGVTPLSSEPAVLDGWRLSFDIPDFFSIEGGTGNVREDVTDEVHGVVHACRDEDLAVLDRLEALGISYERIQATAVTYGGRRVRAYVYRGLAEILEEGKPSARYVNILLQGARQMELDATYVRRLEAIETKAPPSYPPFEPPATPAETFTVANLAERPLHVGLAGAVFDMSDARPRHAYLQRLLAGKDASLLFLRRMDSSDGTESFELLRQNRLSPRQRSHLNDYLHEFDREYRYAGRVDYEASDHVEPEQLLGAPIRQAPAPRLSGAWRLDDVLPPEASDIPARRALLEAELANQRAGHENAGSLSERHGFIPSTPPATKLRSRAHEAWDEVAGELPRLYRTLQLRGTLANLPILPAGPEDLGEEDLLRATQLLAMLSHAYWYVETTPPEGLPESLARPWAEVRRRLGRGPAVLSYVDLIVNNWRLLDAHRVDPMRLDNMELLVPTVDNDEERIFYLTQTEILAHCSPIVGSVVRAQEAAFRDDREALECELEILISCFQRILGESLLQINPSSASDNYVDPVIWAKTVAPFAVPFERGVQGPSGTSSPIFNTLDIFFGRKAYDTFLGEEIKALRDVYPAHWRRFLAALHEVDVPGYIERTGDPNLAGLLTEAVETYAGDNGFLGRHRMKVYGYLELAFKVGRSVTIGGFSGMFQDRTWDRVDDELEASRAERLQRYPQRCYEARVVAVGPADPDAPNGVRHVVLDVSGTGVRYEAGDRCGVLPENRDELVARTLVALGLDGEQRIELTDEWRDSVRLRAGYRDTESLTAREVLRFGRIRPVTPRLAEAVHALTQHAGLRSQIDRHTTERLELWELVEQLKTDGIDPRGLWDGDPEQLCRVVPPETFRLYSIASVMSSASGKDRREIHLTVGRIAYVGPRGAEQRLGTASHFLAEAEGRAAPISIVIVHPPRFSLPRDPRRPIVMIGGGTGISPFRAFLVERARQRNAGPTSLFLGLRTRAHLELYADELIPHLARGDLDLEVAFSRDAVRPRFVPDGDGGGRFVYEPGAACRIGAVLEARGRELWEHLRSTRDGGAGGYAFVCGRSGFARSTLDALKGIVARERGGDEAGAQRFVEALVGERRLLTDIFTDAGPVEAKAEIDVSELVTKNCDDHGWWMAIDGAVYDLTNFLRQHPGGDRVLEGYCGMDASEGWRRAHEGRTEVEAMLQMYEIGSLRRPRLEGLTGLVEGPTGPQKASFAGLHRLWMKALFLVVEMENALRADHSLRLEPAHGVPSEMSPYVLQRTLETHRRFIAAYLQLLVRDPLVQLGRMTLGLLDASEDEAAYQEQLARTEDLEHARSSAAVLEELERHAGRLVERGVALDGEAYDRLRVAADAFAAEDTRLLQELKSTLRTGVLAFERHEARTPTDGREALLTSVQRLPALFDAYYERTARRLAHAGWAVRQSRLPPPSPCEPAPEAPRCVLLQDSLWVMEENAERGYVMLRRTPEEVTSLDDLVRQNDEVIGLIRPEHEEHFGLVCDFREVRGRNDPAFEGAMKRLRTELTTRFPRVAVLLASEAGVLQVNRLRRTEGNRTFATQSETAAIRFAMLEEMDVPPSQEHR